MMNLLAQSNFGVLEDFARSNVLVALDYDGTLAPIVADPERAAMRPRTQALLTAVALRYPVIVISGRAQTDVVRRLRGVGVAAAIGNHGIESWHVARASVPEVRGWLPSLASAVAPFKGVSIEDKSFSIAVHYRRSREKRRARAAILAAAARLPGARVVSGKQVVNLLPKNAPHKGVALERARARLGCDTAIYVGDDVTDEDVFMLDQPGRLLGVRVGVSAASVAAYAIPNQRAIDRFLRALVECRRAVPREREAM
jgi:trehalose 6-phosphate phosphatase